MAGAETIYSHYFFGRLLYPFIFSLLLYVSRLFVSSLMVQHQCVFPLSLMSPARSLLLLRFLFLPFSGSLSRPPAPPPPPHSAHTQPAERSRELRHPPGKAKPPTILEPHVPLVASTMTTTKYDNSARKSQPFENPGTENTAASTTTTIMTPRAPKVTIALPPAGEPRRSPTLLPPPPPNTSSRHLHRCSP